MTEEVARITLTEQELFERLTTLEEEVAVRQADIAQLKKDASFDKKKNPNGIAKAEVALIAKSAKLEAARNFEEKQEATNAVFAKYIELSGYNN